MFPLFAHLIKDSQKTLKNYPYHPLLSILVISHASACAISRTNIDAWLISAYSNNFNKEIISNGHFENSS